MVTLTIFTPTFNRAYCLHRGYEALCRQSCKDFQWLIIDDGSADNTRELVESWMQNDNGFDIRYVYKDNGGLASGYNTAIALTDTELCVCVDSDDYLTDDAVEKVLRFWENHRNEGYAGIIGLDCLENGEVLGDPFPDQKSINLIDLYVGRYSINNRDRKNIVRTDLYKSVAPMKVFRDERDINPHLMHLQISEQYDFLVLNEKLCVVEYQTDGMTNTVIRQYMRSPKSFRETRLYEMRIPNAPIKFVLKKTIHYVSSCILSGEPCISASPRKLLTVLLYPLGVLLTLYVRFKNSKT
ncbi:MAG: glycosyltransferase family 2 protein [Lachnospiraceae bacterium]|nr:glycosyltransferase family 2 protein [Lachnospiraceae bacterium]